MPESWGGPEGYEYLMGRWSRILAQKFLEWARVPSRVEVLDVGCGTGVLAEVLLRGGVKSVVGIDPSSAYVEYATSRLGRMGDASFKVGDAMDLPFPNDSFGAVLSTLVLNFIPDPLRAAEEMRRVTRKSGLIAGCVWDYAGRMEMLRFFWDAAVTLNPEAGNLDEGIRFPVCHPGNLVKLFREAGLSRVDKTHIDVPMEFANFEDYWTPFLSGQGPAGGYAMRLSEKDRQALREALRSRLRARSDGGIGLTARAWAVRGTKE